MVLDLKMSRIWCILFLGGWLALSQGTDNPGAIIKLDIGTIDHAVSTAVAESDILQKMAKEATKKKPNIKPIKGISGVKVKDIRPPVITLTLLPGKGLFMAVLIRMTIAGKSFIGGNLEITVASNLTANNKLLKDALGTPKFSSENCHFSLVSVKTNLPSSMLPKVLNKFLDNTLQKMLPGLLCPAVDAVLDLVNAKLSAMTSEISLGTAGTLQYALLNQPTTNETFIQLDLKTVLHQKEGDEIDLPTDELPLTSLPPKKEAATQLILSANFLSAELQVMQESFSLDITDNMVLGLPPLVTSMLGTVIPEIAGALPPSQPLVIAMREAKPPLVTITPEAGFVHFFNTAEFLVSPSGSAPESLFVLDVHSDLKARFVVKEEKLCISLALDSLAEMALASSSIGTFDVLPLKGVLANIIHVAYMPSINEALQGGIPLPNLLGIKYQQAEISMSENALVLNVPVAEA
ncbi:BPI fold-containing family B member 6 [Apteryx mantelli]|uniref:BPI fold-containing family B member 6 n=1 Tax=Apteryx mantelli TaxID=2696672 RepID=A0ABM4FFS0_9AVES